MEAMLVCASCAILRVVTLSMPYFSMQVMTASRIRRRVVDFSAMRISSSLDAAHLGRQPPELPGRIRVQGISAGCLGTAMLPVDGIRDLNGWLCGQEHDPARGLLRRHAASSSEIPGPACEE